MSIVIFFKVASSWVGLRVGFLECRLNFCSVNINHQFVSLFVCLFVRGCLHSLGEARGGHHRSKTDCLAF